MRRRLIVLRPEPGNAATCRRIEAVGGAPIAMPLFAVHGVDWTPPDADRFGALVLTSANAVRHAGPSLARYAGLPVVAVGQATAGAAAAAGLSVAAVGTQGAGEIAALLAGIGATRALHLAGRDHWPLAGADSVVVYASDPVPVDPRSFDGDVALIHSARAGVRLAELVAPADRTRLAIAAISAAAGAAAGEGWRAAIEASVPTDTALIEAALSIDPPRGAGDKAA